MKSALISTDIFGSLKHVTERDFILLWQIHFYKYFSPGFKKPVDFELSGIICTFALIYLEHRFGFSLGIALMKNVPVYFLTAFAKTSLKDASMTIVNLLSANTTKWSNTLKQCVGNVATNCLSVFDHFTGLVLRGLKDAFINSNATDDAFHLQNLKKALLQLNSSSYSEVQIFQDSLQNI